MIKMASLERTVESPNTNCDKLHMHKVEDTFDNSTFCLKCCVLVFYVITTLQTSLCFLVLGEQFLIVGRVFAVIESTTIAIKVLIVMAFIGSKTTVVKNWLRLNVLQYNDDNISLLMTIGSIVVLFCRIGCVTHSFQLSEQLPITQVLILRCLPEIVKLYMSPLIYTLVFGQVSNRIEIQIWGITTASLVATEFIITNGFPHISLIAAIIMFLSLYQISKRLENVSLNSYQQDSMETSEDDIITAVAVREKIDRKLNDVLVHQMLPKRVAEKLRAGVRIVPEEFAEVTVFFSDIEGFTNICGQVEPIDIVNMLNELYTVMDYCASLFSLYKVETIGDAYMVSKHFIMKIMQRIYSYKFNISFFIISVLVRSPVAYQKKLTRNIHKLLLISPYSLLQLYPK